MSDYTKSTNFATKDNLTPGDPLKIVRGTEIDTEFNNIATAIATKTDNASAAITGGSITGLTTFSVTDDAYGSGWDGSTAVPTKNAVYDKIESLGTLSNGDKGDITVSTTTNPSDTWTIDNSAVTYAKIQNVSATDKILGRSTAGAGTIEEITCTAAGRALIDDADASAQRTTLGLGTISTQASSNVSITGGSITGITDLDPQLS